MAAKKLSVPAADIVLSDGKLFDKNKPESSIAFKDLVKGLRREAVFHGERGPMPAGFAYNTFGAHFAEVEVDTETGRISVLKVVAVHEVGRILNRLTAESQVVGGITQGISTALFEERVLDENTGKMVNPNLQSYKIATSMDMPEIVPLFVDLADPRINNLGNKGLGEPPRIPPSAAVANAVYNAVGIHLREIPMTPDKVLRALQGKEAGS
jgi:xanthine dehydrogenase YagR molybdenum-binding subunit